MTVSRIARHMLLMALALPLILPELAFAQQRREVDPNVTVLERPRPEYDPLGMRAGSFRVLPELAITGAYSDNVEFDEDDEESDFIFTLRPAVELQSDWSRHSLGVELGSELGFYADQNDNDYEDFFADGDGTLEISRQTNLRANAGIRQGHEDQSEGNNDEVEKFYAFDGGLSLSHQLNRFIVTLGGDAERVKFDDNDNDDENRYEYNALLRGTYDVSPRLDVFTEGRYNVLDYDERQDVTGNDQDSDGFEIQVGAGLDLTTVLFGEAFVGYRKQNFDQDDQDEDGVSFGADLNWNVTQLTSIGLTARRDFQPSDEAGANSNFQTQIGLSVAHEFLRNLVVDGSAIYENDDFRGDSNRDDDIIRLGVGATYWVNRNASLNAGYEFSDRDSNQIGQDYTANEISIGLTLRL
ncbi:MAG: outer membrane beta-barrel protein [Geminicoccaceae bacterium]